MHMFWFVARSKIALGFLIVFIVLVGNATVNMYGRYMEAKARADRAAEELALLEERKMRLTADLERLGTPRGTEEELRKRFNVAAEGEKVIVIVDPKASRQKNEDVRTESVWRRIVNFFTFER